MKVSMVNSWEEARRNRRRSTSVFSCTFRSQSSWPSETGQWFLCRPCFPDSPVPQQHTSTFPSASTFGFLGFFGLTAGADSGGTSSPPVKKGVGKWGAAAPVGRSDVRYSSLLRRRRSSAASLPSGPSEASVASSAAAAALQAALWCKTKSSASDGVAAALCVPPRF